MSIDKLSIATRLRAARKIAGYKTSKEFCQKFDIPESSYSTHENGHRGIKEQLLKQYAEYLNFNYKWLSSGQGEPFSHKDFSSEQQTILNSEISLAQKKLQQSPLDKNLLENILEMFFTLLEENNLSPTPKMISNVTAQVYSDVSLNADDIKSRDALINAILRPYILMLKNNS